MTKQNGPRFDEEYLRQGSPTNSTFAESMPILDATDNTVLPATGLELSVGVPLQAGDLVSNITFVTATTAAITPTAGYVALRGPTGLLLRQSADLETTARAANTAYTIPLTTPYLITEAGLYYLALSLTAGTMPTVHGVTLANAVMAGAIGLSRKVLAQSHGSAVAGVAPATTATPTTLATVAYLVAT